MSLQKRFKIRIILILLFFLSITIDYSQSNFKPYIPATRGTDGEVINYSAKDKITGTIKYKLTDVTITAKKF